MESVINTIKGWTRLGGESFSTFFTGGIKTRTRTELLKEYKNIVFACINAIADDVGKYNAIFNTKDARNGKFKPVVNHPFLTLLETPNPNMTGFELWFATTAFKHLTGDAFWKVTLGAVSGQPKELDIMRPDKVEVAVDKDTKEVVGYVFHGDNGVDVPLELEEVMHFKNFNPYSNTRGLGTVQAGLLHIETDNHTAEFQNNFLKNQATPSGVLTLKGKISKEAFQKVKKKWKQQQAGLKNVGKTLFIRQADASFEKIGLSISEIEMDRLTELSEKRVRKMFRVPSAILGDVDSSGLGRANVETVEYIFAKRTVEPELIRNDQTLQKAVRDYYKSDKLYVSHTSQIPQDRAAQLAEDTQSVDKWKTRNEIRAEDGLDPIDGGDKLYVEFSKVSLDDEGDANDSSETKHIHSASCSHTKKKRKGKKRKASNPKTERHFRFLERLEKKTQRKYQKQFRELLDSQKEKVLEVLPSIAGKSLSKDTVRFDGVEFEMEFTRADVTLTLLESLIQALIVSGESAIEFLGLPDVEFLVSQATRNSVFESTERLMRSFNEETALKLQKQMAAGVANQETAAQLTKRVESIYSEAKGFRAKRIAITESHRAVNEGVAQGYKQSGVKKMVWIALPDACQFCEAMHGTIIEIGIPFVVEGGSVEGVDGGTLPNNYTDVQYADLHPNCDCRLEPVLE